MLGVHKPFDRNLHARNDPKSRKIVKQFFAERGVILIDNPDKYDIDLITTDFLLKVEVEHRMNWARAEFPFNKINVPERKSKFFSAGKTHYVILSRDYQYLGFISAKRIAKYIKPQFLEESPNRYVERLEFFYKVPKTEFEFYEIDYESTTNRV